ncbi:hypothetical protein DFA_06226 [Cavenderia fasciculata]|uniref:Uncharacterized protein n=1 Tax=Cavenderia fasciculata TaxID=261658 RepID=F4PKG3_CACFS|nr:uncharacterized protein DFA_06226 [Cavenderia fasciculata]EGG24087.1 hypothetical protein DFA_06226 [Cavenderia fasciculata]|eukprot:XP_004361938.1 hypothetical protein DFA_06226 [Cavenderia fasciculata]
MANIFNTTEYFKKALEICAKDTKTFLAMYQKINYELGLCYATSETPIYATKYLEAYLRSLLCGHCATLHVHTSDCLGTSPAEPLKHVKEWAGVAGGCLQMAKTMKTLGDVELCVSFAKRACYAAKKVGDRVLENESILLLNETSKVQRDGGGFAVPALPASAAKLSLQNALSGSTGMGIPSSTSSSTTVTAPGLGSLKLQLGGQSSSTAKDEADSTTAGFESDDDEDWDAELGLDVEGEDSRPVLQLAGQSSTVVNKDRMPSHYRLIESINNQNFEIVKYPKPSYLYSLTTPDGHSFLHEEALSKWLSSLIIKHLEGQDRAIRVLPQRASLEELRNEFAQESGKWKKNTKKWARLNLEFCCTLHIFGYDEQCWDTIHAFFLDLRDSGASSPLSTSRGKSTSTTTLIPPSSSNHQPISSSPLRPSVNPTTNPTTTTGTTSKTSSTVPAPSISVTPTPITASSSTSRQRMSMEIDEKDATYHYALQMLYLAGKLWKPEEDASFKHMFQGLKNLSVTNAHHVDIIVAETYSHHLHHKSSSSDDDSDNDSDKSDSDEEPELRTRPDEFAGNEEEKINPLNIFLRSYQHYINQQNQQNNNSNNTPSKSPITNAAAAGSSSSTSFTPKPINSIKEYFEVGLKNAMVRALTDIHLHLNGISPLTTKSLGDPIMDVNVPANMTDLLDANYRMKLLTDLYLDTPPTFLKAKAAYALGIHHSDGNDLVLAEKFFFETLYIIDNIRQPIVGLPPVLSELAANASLGYAGVLLDNYKYQYAIVSFDNALLIYNIRKKKEYGTLLRRVAALARENDDINAAIYYYKQILNSYLEDDPQSKTNEIIYICEVISSLYWEKGNYKQSEEYLKVVFLILHKGSTPLGDSGYRDTPKFDNPIFFNLHMKLANLYLESYHIERGLELLVTMRKHNLPHGKLNSLLFLLAKVYTKMEWFDECTGVLNQLENDESGSGIQTSGSSPLGLPLFGGAAKSFNAGPPGGSHIPSPLHANPMKTSYQGGSGNNKIERNLKYWELNCLNYYHSNKFAEALVCVECAIESCPLGSLNARGQYFYIRGKILQKLVSFANVTLINFPTTLRPTSDDLKEIVETLTPAPSYTCTGDLIQEGIASFKRAYHYFKSIGDDVKIQKTVSRIAEVYLDRVFAPCMLLHYPFYDVARLPFFGPSKFIQKDGEQQDDQKKRSANKQPKKPAAETPSINSEVKEFYITFEMIENPATLAMDVNIDTCNIVQLLKSYLNMAELKLLQGDRDLAISYWTETRNLYYNLFFDGPLLIGRGAPLQFLKKVYSVAKRMIRFLFAFDQELINKNLMLVDSYLSLEIDISQAKKRPIDFNKPLSYDSNPQIGKIYMPYLGKAYTIGRNFKKTGRMEVSLSLDKGVDVMSGSPTGANSAGNRLSAKISNLTFTEKTKDEEKTINTGDEVGEKIWGSFHAIKNEMRKYSIGKINQEELASRNKLTIKQILKILNSYKNHQQQNTLLNHSTSTGSYGHTGAGSPGLAVGGVSPSFQSVNSLATLFRSQTKLNLSQMAEGRNRTPSNAGNSSGTIKNLSNRYEELSFNNTPTKINATLQKLVYSLQVDNYFIHYVPTSGRKRFNRIGGSEELTPLTPPTSLLYLQIYLLSNATEHVSFIVSSLITLERILMFLCNRPYWASTPSAEDAAKKKSFFGSFSRSTGNNSLKSAPKFMEKTVNFHNELIGFLNSTIGPPQSDEDHLSDSPPQERSDSHHHHPNHHGPGTPTTGGLGLGGPSHQHTNTHPNLPLAPSRGVKLSLDPEQRSEDHGRSMSVGSGSVARKVYNHQQLSLLSMAKRMVKSEDPAYSKAFVSIDQLSTQICKIFSHREMRECSEQNPLQLFLFVNSNEQRKSLTSLDTPSDKTNDQAIKFSPEIIASLAPLLSLVPPKDPAQEDAERNKIVSELKNTTFASLFEILPLEKEKQPHQQQQQHQQKKPTKSFVFFGKESKSEQPIIPSTNVSTTPLFFICSKSLQVFPWELIIPDFIVRYLTLYDLMKTNYITENDDEEPDTRSIPVFINCCNSVTDKSHFIDHIKKDNSVKLMNYNLFSCTNKSSIKLLNDNHPYLSPLIKLGTKPSVVRKKNKYLDFFDLSATRISGITKFIEDFTDTIHFPILLFAYNDLVDLSQLPLFILRNKQACNVLFIPASKQKEIMSRLTKIYDLHLKQSIKNSSSANILQQPSQQQQQHQQISVQKERYQFLISAIQTIKEEFSTPIVFFNPTFFYQQ